MTIKAVLDRVQNFDASKAITEAIIETKDQIADLNAEQMNRGLRSDGSEILPSYSDLTIQIKKEKGQEFKHVTLKDTGSFYAGIEVTVTGDKLNITSTDSKTAKLNKKYSTSKGNIFGLSPKFKREYTRLRPAFKKKVLAATGLLMK